MDRANLDKYASKHKQTNYKHYKRVPVISNPNLYSSECVRIEKKFFQPEQRSFSVHRPTLGEDVTVAESAHARRARLQYQALLDPVLCLQVGYFKRVHAHLVGLLAHTGQMTQYGLVLVLVFQVALQKALRHVVLLAYGAGAQAVQTHLCARVAAGQIRLEELFVGGGTRRTRAAALDVERTLVALHANHVGWLECTRLGATVALRRTAASSWS